MNFRTFAALTSAITLAFLLLIAASRALGQTETPPPTYLEPGDTCTQPCWLGLQPGQITLDAFLQASREASPYAGHASDYGNGIATSFELSTDGAITLGSAFGVLGTPDRISCFYLDRANQAPSGGLVLAVQVYFAGGWIVVDAVRSDQTPVLDPDMRVRRVTYYQPGEPVYPIGETTPWHGFAAAPRYSFCW